MTQAAAGKSKPVGYTGMQIALHWIVAALIAFQIAAHEGMVDAWRAVRRGEEAGATSMLLANLHAIGGIAILVFALWRLWLRFMRGAPALPEAEHPALKAVATATHVALYAFLLGMPLTGAAAWFGGVEAAGEIHETAKFAMIALVAIHVAGALFQHYWLKTDVLKRMMRPQN